jgi:hypothetical protein
MKPEELRIGNWVKYRGEPVKVEQLRVNCLGIANSDVLVDYNEIEPIELTEEVLLKVGFEKDGNSYRLICDGIRIGYYTDKFKQVLDINVSREKKFYKNELRSYDVKYLHQLQNEYYLLTNKELKIEL